MPGHSSRSAEQRRLGTVTLPEHSGDAAVRNRPGAAACSHKPFVGLQKSSRLRHFNRFRVASALAGVGLELCRSPRLPAQQSQLHVCLGGSPAAMADRYQPFSAYFLIAESDHEHCAPQHRPQALDSSIYALKAALRSPAMRVSLVSKLNTETDTLS